MSNTLGHKIKTLRIKKKYKIVELARLLSADSSLVSRYESDKRIPTESHIKQLETIFEVKQNELLSVYFAQEITKKIKNYEYAAEVLSIVSESVAGYKLLLNSKKEQHIPKKLSKIILKIDEIKAKINELRPLNHVQENKINNYFSTLYTFESNKIEGNTLTFQETNLVLKEGVTIGGKSVKEHLEAINHSEAITYLYELVGQNESLNERFIKNIHRLILKGIDDLNAGTYRKTEVRISGSNHIPPQFFDISAKMEGLINYFNLNTSLHPVILAADIHQILVGIHPFIDGNGRTSRLVMNLILLQNGYYIANIKGSMGSRLKYYKALEKAHVNGNILDFRIFIANHVLKSLNEFYNLIK
ncbi:MAG: Fic family protein [Bacteroidetes bacterium]|nr:Fic family protein [Bacteroidota bacterium]